MNHPFFDPKRPFDAQAIQDTIQRAFETAGLDTRSGPMREVTETIRRALNPGAAPAQADVEAATVIDVQAREVPTHAPNPPDAPAADRIAPTPMPMPTPASAPGSAPAPGRFQSHRFSNAAGTRNYKLYVPSAHRATPCPVLVMLHGCTQSADDFAAGTQMNRLADQQGFVVVYPEQAAQANPSRCWNWFDPKDQRRDAGEPALIAGIVREVLGQHGGDPGRVFVAGLSAGAAMAVVLGQTYPELFAGVGAHSGLPYGSAHDIPSAMAAMKGSRGTRYRAAVHLHDNTDSRQAALQPVPLIALHGDRDTTVQPSNSEQLVRQIVQAHEATAPGTLHRSTHTGLADGQRRFTQTVHADAQGRPRVEHWVLHGAGHAWSGGHPGGSFTDPNGPDASAQMLRFFNSLAPATTR